MIIRIVKMEFQKEKVNDFLQFFDQVKTQIASFEGCLGMKLMQDKQNPVIIFTYSHWENEIALDNYRKSELFGKVWPNVKPLFSESPQAWSLDTYFDQFNPS